MSIQPTSHFELQLLLIKQQLQYVSQTHQVNAVKQCEDFKSFVLEVQTLHCRLSQWLQLHREQITKINNIQTFASKTLEGYQLQLANKNKKMLKVFVAVAQLVHHLKTQQQYTMKNMRLVQNLKLHDQFDSHQNLLQSKFNCLAMDVARITPIELINMDKLRIEVFENHAEQQQEKMNCQIESDQNNEKRNMTIESQKMLTLTNVTTCVTERPAETFIPTNLHLQRAEFTEEIRSQDNLLGYQIGSGLPTRIRHTFSHIPKRRKTHHWSDTAPALFQFTDDTIVVIQPDSDGNSEPSTFVNPIFEMQNVQDNSNNFITSKAKKQASNNMTERIDSPFQTQNDARVEHEPNIQASYMASSVSQMDQVMNNNNNNHLNSSNMDEIVVDQDEEYSKQSFENDLQDPLLIVNTTNPSNNMNRTNVVSNIAATSTSPNILAALSMAPMSRTTSSFGLPSRSLGTQSIQQDIIDSDDTGTEPPETPIDASAAAESYIANTNNTSSSSNTGLSAGDVVSNILKSNSSSSQMPFSTPASSSLRRKSKSDQKKKSIHSTASSELYQTQKPIDMVHLTQDDHENSQEEVETYNPDYESNEETNASDIKPTQQIETSESITSQSGVDNKKGNISSFSSALNWLRTFGNEDSNNTNSLQGNPNSTVSQIKEYDSSTSSTTNTGIINNGNIKSGIFNVGNSSILSGASATSGTKRKSTADEPKIRVPTLNVTNSQYSNIRGNAGETSYLTGAAKMASEFINIQ